MKRNISISILLFITFFSSSIIARKSHRNQFFDLIDENEDVDPNDRVDVNLWNQFNDEDIQHMPSFDDYSSEINAIQWLKWRSKIALRYHQIAEHLEWNHKTNLTEENQQAIADQNVRASSFHRLSLSTAKKFNEYIKLSNNEELKRIFDSLTQSSGSHNDEYLVKASKLHSQLDRIYSTAQACELKNEKKCYTFSPYLERLMQIEKDYDRLLWAWKGWHDQCGNNIRSIYLSYVDLVNENVKEGAYKDLAASWIKDYDMGNETEFENLLDRIYETLKPLYKELHAFVRGRLCKIYPNRFDCNGPIPAHLLGNMWAQEWQDRLEDLLPYPEQPLINITNVLIEKEYTVHQLYETAEEFFTSINLYPMTPKFWARSMFTKPKDREVVCHPSAFDMAYHDDYRVKICTTVNEDYLYTVHHEMGHVEYYMAYKNQPLFYRDGANTAFHEAIGDTIGMYAISPPHLVKLGFLDEDIVTPQYEINFLMRMALQKVAFLPFAYVMDKYRFALFRNQINRETELNSKWWQMRLQYGGLMPPVPRHDPENFDAGAKYHVATNVPYAKYLLAHVLQFQFYRAMCRLQGFTHRWHMCDIYGDKHVGRRFKEMLALGCSKSWPEVLKTLTGESHLEPQAILDYFDPLYRWLKMENLARSYPVDWT